jgi:hypothetical protein
MYPPGIDVSIYDVILEPPFVKGVVQLTVARRTPGRIEILAGGPGKLKVVTGEENTGSDSPAKFEAVTLNIYSVALAKLVRVKLKIFESKICVYSPDLSIYDVIREPPLNKGAIQLTPTSRTPGRVAMLAGALGIVKGITGEEYRSNDSPAKLEAFILNI